MEKFTLREKSVMQRRELPYMDALTIEKIEEESKLHFKLNGKLMYIPMYLKECYGITEQEFDAWLETLPERS